MVRRVQNAGLRASTKLLALWGALVVLRAAVGEAQTCPPVPSPAPNTTSVLSIRTGDGSCPLENGGYIKTSATDNVRLHVTASTDGGCQTRTLSGGQCVNVLLQGVTLGYTDQSVDSTHVSYMTTNIGITHYDSTTSPPTN